MSTSFKKSTSHRTESYLLQQKMALFEQRTLAAMLLEARRSVSSVSQQHIDKLLAQVALKRQAARFGELGRTVL